MNGASLLFDLDETLVVDGRVAVEAFKATACVAAERRLLNAGRLAEDGPQARPGGLLGSAEPLLMRADRHELVGRPVVWLRR